MPNPLADMGNGRGMRGLDVRLLDFRHARSMVKEAVYLYYTDRPHLDIDYVLPSDVYYGIVQNVPPVIIPASEEVSP